MTLADAILSCYKTNMKTTSLISLFTRLSLTAALALATFACGPGENNDPDEVDRTVYPSAPFGVVEGAVIEDLTFPTWDGSTTSLSELRADENKKLLLLTTSAGWCAACIEEQPFLRQLHIDNEARGLTVLVSVFEDSDTNAADEAYAAEWREIHDLPFDVLVDADTQLGAYYDTALTPMNMFVDLDTMEMIKIGVGADRGLVESIVSSQLQ